MDAASAFIVELVNTITTFHARVTISMFRNHGLVSERIQLKLRNRYCAAPGGRADSDFDFCRLCESSPIQETAEAT